MKKFVVVAIIIIGSVFYFYYKGEKKVDILGIYQTEPGYSKNEHLEIGPETIEKAEQRKKADYLAWCAKIGGHNVGCPPDFKKY